MEYRGHNGWVIVFSLAFVNCVVLGATNCTIGIFIPAVTQAFHSTGELASLSATLFILAMTITSPIVGWLADSFGSRRVMVAGIAVAALGYCSAANSSGLAIYNLSLLIAGAGVGFSTFVPSAFVVSQWIIERRGLAFGLLLGGASLGAAIFPPLVSWIIKITDWRFALYCIATMIFVIPLPLLINVVRENPSTKKNPTEQNIAPAEPLRAALVTPGYWLLTLMQMLASFSYMGTYYFIVPHWITAGYPSEIAALSFGALGISSLLGYIIFGSLADRIGPQRTLIAGLSLCACSAILLLVPAGGKFGLPAIVAFILFWGATFNLCNQLAPLLQIEIVGAGHFGLLLGISTLLAGIASSLGPLLSGIIFDSTKSYILAFKIFAVLMASATIPIALVMAIGARKPSATYSNLGSENIRP